MYLNEDRIVGILEDLLYEISHKILRTKNSSLTTTKILLF
jgi:hypothetical protein